MFPSQLSVAPGSASPATTIALSWQDNASNETGFTVERSAGGAFTQIGQVGANVTTYLDTGLAPNTAYDYRVFAFNGSGNSSYSNIGSGRTAAGSGSSNTAPTVTLSSPANNASFAEGVSITFAGSATDTQDGNLTGSLQWTSSLSGALGTGGSLTRSLSAGTHVITASVSDSGGLPASRQVTIVVTGTGTPPMFPSQLSVAPGPASPATTIALSWQDNANNETGFTIERSAGGAFVQVAQVGANVTTYLDSGLAANTAYDYRVAAFNGAGTSFYSNIGSGRTGASGSSNTAPTVTVTSPSNNASFAGGASITFSGSATDAQDGNLTGNLQWTSSLSGALGTGGSIVRTLPSGTHVITASVNDSGGLAGSMQVTITVAGTATMPIWPSQVSAKADTASPSTSIRISWQDNSDNETGFRLERSTGGAFTLLAQLGANVTTYVDTNLNPNTAYDYRLTAINGAGQSIYSNIASGRTTAGEEH